MFILAFIKHKTNSKKLYCFSEILIENTRKKNNWQNKPNMCLVKSELFKITLISDLSNLKGKNILKMNYFAFKL